MSVKIVTSGNADRTCGFTLVEKKQAAGSDSIADSKKTAPAAT